MYKIWVTCVPLSVSGWMGHLHDGVILLLRPESFSCIFGYPKIHHFHISPHSPPCLAPPTPTPPPQKKIAEAMLSISLGTTVIRRRN